MNDYTRSLGGGEKSRITRGGANSKFKIQNSKFKIALCGVGAAKRECRA